jgi:predicted NAD/FAD-binding protein
MRIAVIGAGLAGLSAAWRLAVSHRVTVFERQAGPGFTASNVSVPWRGRELRVDVPLRVFYPGYYPTLGRLYRELGVASEPVDYAAAIGDASGRLVFRHRNLRLGGWSWPVLAPSDWLLGSPARAIVAGALRLHREGRQALESAETEALTIGEFVERGRYPRAFVDGFLLPAIATICTCTLTQARGFPARVILDYLRRGLASQSVRRARLGADDVQQRLLARLDDVRCAVRIAGVRREGRAVVVQVDGSPPERFDQVVFATQANQARRLLADARADEAAVLDAIRYTPVEVVTHRDERLMPARPRDWSPVHLMLSPGHDVPEATIWINAVQAALRGAPPVLQTVHPLRAPREELVLGRARFERPIVDAASQRAVESLERLHAEPGRTVWFCGSYAQPGIPLLESAVRSAEVVVDAIGRGSMGPAPSATEGSDFRRAGARSPSGASAATQAQAEGFAAEGFVAEKSA